VRLTVLGCSGTFPGATSPCSGYLVEHDGYRLLVDLGNGALGHLQRHVDLAERNAIDAVYISHVHGDHCLDLVPWSYARRYHPRGQDTPVPVYGPVGLRARIASAYEVHPPPDGLLEVFDFREVPAGEHTLGPFAVSTKVMRHPVESHGVRLTAGGGTLVYSSDTATCDALTDLARGSDLFLCEASWPAEPTPPEGMHLTGVEAGAHAAAAGVARLLLTHVLPFHDPQVLLAEARTTFDGPVEVAACGASYDV